MIYPTKNYHQGCNQGKSGQHNHVDYARISVDSIFLMVNKIYYGMP